MVTVSFLVTVHDELQEIKKLIPMKNKIKFHELRN